MWRQTTRTIEYRVAVLLMAVLPWLPWIVDDWLTSRTRLAMNPTERSIYQDLLAFQWRDEHLPSDHQTLAAMAAVPSEVFEAAAPAVLRHFNLRRGRLRNKKLSVLRESAFEKSTKHTRKSQKGGLAKASKFKEICATGTPQADTRARAHSDSISSPGFLGSDSKPPNQEKSSSRAREVLSGADGNGRPEYNWAAGWERVVAVCQRPPVAPQILKAKIARDLFFSDCETPEREAEILDAIERLKASGMVERGFVPSLENMFRDGALSKTAIYAPHTAQRKPAEQSWLEKKKAQQVANGF